MYISTTANDNIDCVFTLTIKRYPSFGIFINGFKNMFHTFIDVLQADTTDTATNFYYSFAMNKTDLV